MNLSNLMEHLILKLIVKYCTMTATKMLLEKHLILTSSSRAMISLSCNRHPLANRHLGMKLLHASQHSNAVILKLLFLQQQM